MRRNQNGLITMLVIMLLIVAAVVFFAYTRVKNAQG